MLIKCKRNHTNTDAIFLKVFEMFHENDGAPERAATDFIENHFVSLKRIDENKKKIHCMVWKSELGSINIEMLMSMERLAFIFGPDDQVGRWHYSGLGVEKRGAIPIDKLGFGEVIRQTLKMDILYSRRP